MIQRTASSCQLAHLPPLSRAAVLLYTASIMNGLDEGRPTFVSDSYLNSITVETTLTAAELCAVGVGVGLSRTTVTIHPAQTRAMPASLFRPH